MVKYNRTEGDANLSGICVYEKMLKHDAYDDFVAPYFKAMTSFALQKENLQKAKKAKVLGLPGEEHYNETAKVHHNQGIRRIRTSKTHIEKAIGKLEKINQSCKEMSKSGREEVISEFDVLFKNSLFRSGVPSDVTTEVWHEYTEIKKLAIEKGRLGLLEYGNKKLAVICDLKENLGKVQMKGNPVPVPIIEIAAIAILIGVVVGAVIECYNKYGCVWVENMFNNLECSWEWTSLPVECWSQKCRDRWPYELPGYYQV